MRILFVSANPHWTARLDLGDEMRELLNSLRGQEIDLMMLPAAQSEDLKVAVASNNIDILHFSGHATEQDGILLRDKDGMEQAVSGSELRQLIEGGEIKLAFLNACNTEATAKAIENSVDAVIGTTEKLDDEAAKKMTKVFYSVLSGGGSIEQSFDEATKTILDDGFENVYMRSGDAADRSLLSSPGSDESAVKIKGQTYYDKYFFINYLDEQIRNLKGRVTLNRVIFWILFVLGVTFFAWLWTLGAEDEVDLKLLVDIIGEDRIDHYIGKPYLDSMIAIGAGIPVLLSFLQSRLTLNANQALKSLMQMKEMAKASENLTPELQDRLQKIVDQCIRGADRNYQPLIDWYGFFQKFRLFAQKVSNQFLGLFGKERSQQT